MLIGLTQLGRSIAPSLDDLSEADVQHNVLLESASSSENRRSWPPDFLVGLFFVEVDNNLWERSVSRALAGSDHRILDGP
jgi:hypothetical protein